MPNPQDIFIGLGANLESPSGQKPLETFRRALAVLSRGGVRVLGASKVYQSAPHPPSSQPWYTNAVVSVETELSPEALLEVILRTERKLGRERGQKNAPRIIDLDLIDYKGLVRPDKKAWLAAQRGGVEKGFFLPHLRAHQRNFVLKPLLGLAPGWRHPVFETPGKGLLEKLENKDTIRGLEEPLEIP